MSYIITATSQDGRTVYFDGRGFTLLRANAQEFDVCAGVAKRSQIGHEFPACQLVQA